MYAYNTIMIPYCHFHGCLRFWSHCVLGATSCFCKAKFVAKFAHGPECAGRFVNFVLCAIPSNSLLRNELFRRAHMLTDLSRVFLHCQSFTARQYRIQNLMSCVCHIAGQRLPPQAGKLLVNTLCSFTILVNKLSISAAWNISLQSTQLTSAQQLYCFP